MVPTSLGYADMKDREKDVGNQIIPRTFYGPGKTFDERASAWREADNWMTFLRAKFPQAITFLYLPDEPDLRSTTTFANSLITFIRIPDQVKHCRHSSPNIT